MQEYNIKKIEKNDFDLLIPLMKDCFGMDVNLDYFKWKFIDNPSGFVLGFVALSKENEVAAYYGVIPETYIINGESRIIYQSCDTMTHSKHRRKGLFQKLATHCYEYLKSQNQLFVIGFGGGESTPGFLKFGWKQIFEMKYYFYLNKFSVHKILKLKSEVVPLNSVEQLVVSNNFKSKIHSWRNDKILQWRISNPRHDYKIIGLKGDAERFASYLIYYTENNKIVLFDLIFKNFNESKKLIRHLKQIMVKEKMEAIISFAQPNTKLTKSLNKNLFVTNPLKFGPLSNRTPFIFYASEREMMRFISAENWVINSFDHDSL